MKRTVLALVTAAFVAPAGFAVAQSQDTEMMTPALSMLELSVTRALSSIGIQGVDMASLTLSDLAQIKSILENDDSEGQKRRTVQAIIDN